MKQMNLSKAAIATAVFAGAAMFSFGWSEQSGVSLSIESAQARVGRPLTPMSVAGVGRRQARRAAYGYGAGVVGAGVGAAAIGTAAAVSAATQPWGWGGGPYVGSGYYGGGPLAARAYYGGRTYAGTSYYGGAPPATRAAYAAASYYDSYGAASSCTPGALYIAADGLVQMCK